MNELLSPAGTIDAFYAAISNGANAIYLGLDKFSARAYAENFTLDNLKDLVQFAHLRNVKIFVTINTIVYDFELQEIYKTLEILAGFDVDAIIVQDLAVFNYIVNNFKSLHAHVSTQMGIDDIYGAKLVKELGAKRIVFARETPLQTIKSIKQNLGIEVEAFIHGALCVAYSGNCLMSSMIGERSGNRGRCAGCCRQVYSLIDLNKKETIKTGYLLSMKDLNVSEQISNFNFIDSLKIEGRMKEPFYVAGVTNYYRKLLDNQSVNKDDILKVFNRTYTKGFINNETSENITNIERPNNYGYLIGTIVKVNNEKIWIRLNKELNKGDQLRIETNDLYKEISIPVLKIFDSNFNIIESSNSNAIIECKQKVYVGAKVYKTKDILFNKEVEKSYQHCEYEKLSLSMDFSANLNENLLLKVQYENYKVYVKSDVIAEEAKTTSTTKENIINQLSKLNDTPYKLTNIDLHMEDNLFIPLKVINEMRREAIEKLNSSRLNKKIIRNNNPINIIPKNHDLHRPEITVEVSTEEQYEAAIEANIQHIYYKNIVNRNNANYIEANDEVLVGGLGGIEYYRNKNIKIVSDYSLNVSNYKSAAILSSIGVDRITLSEEISKDNINNLVKNYFNEYKTYPNLELIVYGRTKLMHTKYCPLKRLGLCGKCKTNYYGLRDEFATFPIKFNGDCTLTILNSKILNNIDEISSINGVNFYRLRFTTESKEEVKTIINALKQKINGGYVKTFNASTNTRGHFKNNPL